MSNGITLTYSQLFDIIKEAENLEKDSKNKLPSASFNINVTDPYILDDMNIWWNNPYYNSRHNYNDDQINNDDRHTNPHSNDGNIQRNYESNYNDEEAEIAEFRQSLPPKKKKAKPLKRLKKQADDPWT